MRFTNLINHLLKVVTGNKSSVFHFEFDYQSESFLVVLSDRQIHWNSIHIDKETIFVV